MSWKLLRAIRPLLLASILAGAPALAQDREHPTDRPLDVSGERVETGPSVDGVPVSLVLSQAAEESGWGTSRFAAEGNALFGQWAWGDKAIKPKQQRKGKGNYGIAAFDTTLDSVRAYMQNLNTHRAYGELRGKRAELREQGEPVTGRILAGTLTSYSERGAAYVETLHTIMNANRLDPADDAYLDDGPVYLMVPVGDDVRTE